ncbi:uncharacterized protein [Apostichopus japonicus]|uniref:uncharacterized protein n=1 Tax=Stichopus japonicus TaxID=307972 RepID=UPI003AB12706
MYAVKDAVSGRDYATTEATNMNDIPESTFLPTSEDNTLLQTDFAFLWSRVIVDSIPRLQLGNCPKYTTMKFTGNEQFCVLVNNMLLYNVKEITYLNHLYLQVPLGITCRNENKSEEMIAILEKIHNKYLPCLDDDEATKKVTGNNEMHSVNHDNAVDRQRRKHVTHLNVWSNEYTFLSSGVSFCGRWVHKGAATRRSHESRVHGIADQHTEESQRQEEDHKSNYGCATIGLGLLLRNADDAVREGDGARIIQVWKFLMPLFKLHKHNK